MAFSNFQSAIHIAVLACYETNLYSIKISEFYNVTENSASIFFYTLIITCLVFQVVIIRHVKFFKKHKIIFNKSGVFKK